MSDKRNSIRILGCVLALVVSSYVSGAEDPTPVILDTDIGSHIDDAFALSLLLADHDCQLLGVTTCGSQAQDRAWMVCRLLTALDRKDIPVAYGRDPQPKSPIDWQIQYRRHPAVVWNRTIRPAQDTPADLMNRLVEQSKRPVTIIAIGPLTNIARLLTKHPDAKRGIKQIVVMGGSVKIGYDGKPPAIAEWNIKQDIPAAETVFTAGVPLLVVPVDAGWNVKLTDAMEKKLFDAHTPLCWELQSLWQLWEGERPALLFDAVAASAALKPEFGERVKMQLTVDNDGKTIAGDGAANATVLTKINVERFLRSYIQQVTSYGKPVLPQPPKNIAKAVKPRGLPKVVHAFEDYDNEIERRWWMTGKLETEEVPQGSRRACRAVLTQDYDAKMGDTRARYKAVIFNPVPGPPIGGNTRLRFRYRLIGTDKIRVQLFSLSNGYHRYLTLEDLPQDEWSEATVDMTQMRRPDGSGGPLAKDERIDDIQFYIDPRADLIVDEMILYEPAGEKEQRPFPQRMLFTGWFDTGKQGNEWPGDFEIVLHEKPRTWDAAKSVVNKQTGKHWIRLHLRGPRRLATNTALRFDYLLQSANHLTVVLVDSTDGKSASVELKNLHQDQWDEAETVFQLTDKLSEFSHADELHFLVPEGARLQIDNLLLYEPR